MVARSGSTQHPVDRGGITIALGEKSTGFNDPVVLKPADAAALGRWLLELAGDDSGGKAPVEKPVEP